GNVGAPLEHDVLEEVGEAGASGLLVTGPDVVPHVHRNDGDGPVLVNDQAQPVLELEELVGQPDLLSREGDGGEQEGDQQRGDSALRHGTLGVRVATDNGPYDRTRVAAKPERREPPAGTKVE